MQRKLVFVSDFFVEQYTGGAELTMQAIIDAKPSWVEVQKVQSHNLSTQFVKQYKDDYWVLVNYSRVPRAALVELVLQEAKFSIIECDYKYCVWRSSHVHERHDGKACTCETTEHGKFIRGMMKRADAVFFMSEGQRDEYIKKFPSMASWNNIWVQASTWSPEQLDELEALRLATPVKNGRSAVLSDQGGMLWVKNQGWTEDYLKNQGKPYDVVGGGLPYSEFIKQLSEYSSLCFHPLGYDTCPRIVIEAKLMGLELDLGDLVQHTEDSWWKEQNHEELTEWLSSRASWFWLNLSSKLV